MEKNVKNQIKEKDLENVNGGARKIDPILKPGVPEPVKKIGINELPSSPESINDNGRRIDPW